MTITTEILAAKINGMVLDERGYVPVVLAAKVWEKAGKRRVYVMERPVTNGGRARDYAVIDVENGAVTIGRNLHPVLGQEMLKAAWRAAAIEADGSIP
jgi:hypothetical protein